MPDQSAANLSPTETRDLSRIAGIMIPASKAFDVPGADDPAIFADIVQSLGRDLADVKDALATLARLSGGSFAELDAPQAAAIAGPLLAGDDRSVTALGRAVLQCYYRDDRVLRALGLEPGAPFPRGHAVEQGDWSLLDPVRGRQPFWREDRGF